jgi:hypothetical protein
MDGGSRMFFLLLLAAFVVFAGAATAPFEKSNEVFLQSTTSMPVSLNDYPAVWFFSGNRVVRLAIVVMWVWALPRLLLFLLDLARWRWTMQSILV